MLNLNLKDYYYAASIITGMAVILIINNNTVIKTNKYLDLAFFITILLIPEIKFSILLTFIYLSIKWVNLESTRLSSFVLPSKKYLFVIYQ